jgi:hypothetical protein
MRRDEQGAVNAVFGSFALLEVAEVVVGVF